jgi:hypothetical protein
MGFLKERGEKQGSNQRKIGTDKTGTVLRTGKGKMMRDG